MSHDLICCGICSIKFNLSDITLFIEHKKNNCAVFAPEPPSLTPEDTFYKSNDFVSSILECVRCLRKFPTALPFLMHMQLEHQLLLANYISTGILNPLDNGDTQQPQPSQVFNQTSVADPSEYAINTPQPESQATEQPLDSETFHLPATPILNLPITSQAFPAISLFPELLDVGTQTVVMPKKQNLLSCPCGPSIAKRRKLYRNNPNRRTSCCSVSSGKCNSSQLPPVNQTTTTCPCSVKSEGLYCNFIERQSRTEQLSSLLDCCVATSQSPSVGKVVETDYDETLTPRCYLSSCCRSSEVNAPSSFCCPCPQSRRTPKVTSSTEAQTDFDPEFASSGDFMDLSLLFATPESNEETGGGIINFDIDFEIEKARRDHGDDVEHGRNDTKQNAAVMSMPGSLSAPPVDVVNLDNNNYVNIIDVSSSPYHTDNVVQYEAEIVHLSAGDPRNLGNGVPKSVQSRMELPVTVKTCPTSAVADESQGFACVTCGRKFNQKVHLRKHVLTQHIRKKPHSCPICAYTTVERSHLTVHMRTHTGERPFHCRNCTYSSTQNCTLKAHYLRKHPNSRIQCDTCSQSFYTDMEFLKHKRICLTDIL